MHSRAMGRASGRHRQQATGNVVPLGLRSTRSPMVRMDPELDALWFPHAEELKVAAELLQDVDTLNEADSKKLCATMEDVARTVGLDGPWCVLESADGHAALAYCSTWEPLVAPKGSPVNWHVLPDRFDGGLIDHLPEARFLGRQTLELAQAVGNRASATA